ncbi:hypothetical protein [Halopseudomonas sp.]|uniref:hypothetical protein n=1 Tax=Halopseudomonas sp. TaxID=2901191 RepID=UPI0031201EAC
MTESVESKPQNGEPAQPEAADTELSPDAVKAVDELLDHSVAWLRQLLAAGGELATLLRLELQLTLGDARRMLLLTLLLVPLLLFTWLLLGALAGWLIWLASASVSVALSGVLGLHALGLWLLLRQLQIYQRSLGFRRTKAHLKRLLQGADHESPSADS